MISQAHKLQFALLFVFFASAVSGQQPDRESKAAGQKSRPQVVYLHTEFFPTTKIKFDQNSLLTRELTRQAFYVAAEHELGVAVRDATLRESIPAGVDAVNVAVLTRCSWKGDVTVRVYVPSDAKEFLNTKGLWDAGTPLWEKRYRYQVRVNTICISKAQALAQAITTDFADVLKQAGVKQAPSVTLVTDDPNSEAWETDLLSVDYVKQFGVVREVHQAIADRGETAERLGMLVRGYANLFALTKHQFNSVQEVFAARALIYAQRMITAAKIPSIDFKTRLPDLLSTEQDDVSQQAFALWHRAYAYAMTGNEGLPLRHIAAIQTQRDRAAKLASDNDPTNKGKPTGDDDDSSAPAWTALIEPYCNWEPGALERVGDNDKSLLPWSRKLRFQQHDLRGYHEPVYQAASDYLQIIPADYGMYAELAQYSRSLAGSRRAVRWGPSALAYFLPRSIDAMQGLPKEIRERLPNDNTSAWLMEKLLGDTNTRDQFSPLPSYIAKQLKEYGNEEVTLGPSMSALAFVIQEEVFLQAFWKLNVGTNSTEGTWDAGVDDVVALLKDHRYVSMLKSFRHNWQTDWDNYQNTIKDIEFDDPRGNMSKMFNRLSKVMDGGEEDLRDRYWNHCTKNHTVWGFSEYYLASSQTWHSSIPKSSDYISNGFTNLSPHSDVGRRMNILGYSKKPKKNVLKRWEKDVKHDPLAFQAIGDHYREQKQPKNAIRLYKKSLEQLPLTSTVEKLANTYQDQGDLDNWEDTYLDFLNTSDSGLSHAWARRNLASGMLKRKQWKAAVPHARHAGKTYSGFGLDNASYVTEGMAMWKESEQWARALSESYPTYSAAAWYWWCQRTGRGDLEAAREFAAPYFSRPTDRFSRDRWVGQGAYHLLENDRPAALEAYKKALEFYPSLSCTCMVSQLARATGDQQTHQQVIAKLIEVIESEEPDDSHPFMLHLLELLQSDKIAAASLLELEEKLSGIESGVCCRVAFIVGQELASRNQPELAETWYRHCLRTHPPAKYYPALSGAALTKIHGVSRPDDSDRDNEDYWPPTITSPDTPK